MIFHTARSNTVRCFRSGTCPVVVKLEKNTFVEDLTSEHLCVHSTLQLSHFFENKSKSSALNAWKKEQERTD
jgi:hypothetical protein